MEIEKNVAWLKPERVLKLTDQHKNLFGSNRMFIIGLGKNGVDCALRCKHITEKRFGTDSKKMRYLGIGESKYLESAECEGTILTEEERVSVVPEDAIYKYLNSPGRLPEYAQSWFDDGLKNYSPAAPIYGLNKRQCGRIALFHYINMIIKRISESMAAFCDSDKAVEVVLTGNAGDIFFGGMFIDIAYILKKLFETAPYPVKVNCYMFMPDTAVLFEYDQREQGNYFANSILTKKELDKFQCNKTAFNQKYTASFEVSSDKVPFNAVFITRAEKNYSYTLDMTAEKILNRMEIIFTKDDDAERIMSYNMLKQNESHDFRYLAFNVNVREIPLGDIVSYLCIKVFTLINHSLNKNNVGLSLLKEYGAMVTPDEKMLAQKGGDCPALDFDENINPCFSAKALKVSNEGAEEYITKWLDRITASTEKGSDFACDEILNRVTKFCDEAKVDFSKGPFYAAELLRKCLADLRVAIAKVNADITDMEEQVLRSRKLVDEAYKKIKTIPLFLAKNAEQYIFELKEYAECSCKLRTGGTLKNFYQSVYDQLNEYLENVIGKATEAFESVAVNRKSIIEEFSRDTSEIFCAVKSFTLNTEGVTDKLDKLVEEIPESKLSEALVESGILDVSLEDEKALPSAVLNIVLKCFPEFLSKNFAEMGEFFGVEEPIRNSVKECIDSVDVWTPVTDDFALNRVVCPKPTRQDDVIALRGEYTGMNYIWNGSVLNMTTAVSQIKAGIKLEEFPDYDQWENMHYAYVNDSLKKHGLHVY